MTVPPAESPIWKPLAMAVISVLVGIGGAMAYSGQKTSANTERIHGNEIAIAVGASERRATNENVDEVLVLLREIASEMRAYHAPR